MTDQDFEAFVAARWPTLVRAARLLGHRMPEAEDLVQTTLVRCFVHWRSVAAAGDQDRYVYRMLLNQHRSRRRRRWGGESPSEHIEPSAEDGAPGPIEAAERTLMVRAALARLSDDARQVVVLRHFLECSTEETAEILQIPVGTVKTRLARALAALAKDMEMQELALGDCHAN